MDTKNYTNAHGKFNTNEKYKNKTGVTHGGGIHGKVDKENLTQYLLKHQDAFHETTGFPTSILQDRMQWSKKVLKMDKYDDLEGPKVWRKIYKLEEKTDPLRNYIKNLPTKEKIKATNKIKK